MMNRAAIEKRVEAAQRELEECQRLLAEPVEEWVECSAGEAFEAMLAGRRVQATVYKSGICDDSRWAEVRQPGLRDQWDEFYFDCGSGDWIDLSWRNAENWKWRILAKDKPREVVLRGMMADRKVVVFNDNDTDVFCNEADHLLKDKFDPGTKVTITIKEEGGVS